MKPRFALLVVLLVVQLAAPAAVSATYGDYAAGRGRDVNLGTFHFTAEGFGGPLSSNAGGTMRYRRQVSHFSVTGNVQCLNVVGNTAVVGGIITRSTSDAAEGAFFRLTVQDNADPGDAADRFLLQFPGPDDLEPCGIPDFQGFPIVDGDIEVVESTFPF